MPDNISEWVVALVTTYGVKIVLALAIYLIGKCLVALATDLMAKAMTSRNVDPTVGNFVKNISYYLLLALVVVAALGQLGVETASAIAILGGAYVTAKVVVTHDGRAFVIVLRHFAAKGQMGNKEQRHEKMK